MMKRLYMNEETLYEKHFSANGQEYFSYKGAKYGIVSA